MTDQRGGPEDDRIVAGGGVGVGGLALALVLVRAGRNVTLLERDRFDDHDNVTGDGKGDAEPEGPRVAELLV